MMFLFKSAPNSLLVCATISNFDVIIQVALFYLPAERTRGLLQNSFYSILLIKHLSNPCTTSDFTQVGECTFFKFEKLKYVAIYHEQNLLFCYKIDFLYICMLIQ